jgi:hypothetical protein
MNNAKEKLNYFTIKLIVVLSFILIFPLNASASTNISATSTSHWAWNDIIGWINFYSSQNVNVSLNSVTGYANTTSAGIISLDCGTVGVCGTVNYGVSNDGAGNLSGWAWNDKYGWISFWSGNNGGSIPYRVKIDINGNFSGWAWNDVVGWISFNCYQPLGSNSCGTSNYEVQTLWAPTSTSGYLDSQTFDTGDVSGAQLNSVLWHGYMPSGVGSTGVGVGFQFAVSNSSSGPWNFVGPNGIANSTSSFWNASTPGYSIPLSYVFYNNFRYFRYRVIIFSNTSQTMSPRIDDVEINWSP